MKGSDAGSVQLTSSSCCVRSDVPAACWECEGKAGLRPRGTSYSPACSAQSLSPCLCGEADQRAERAQRTHHIRELWRGWTRTSLYVSQWGTLRGARVHRPSCEQPWNKRAAALRYLIVRFGARLNVLGGWERMVIEPSKHPSMPTVCGSDQ